jgi:hypothetical protein
VAHLRAHNNNGEEEGKQNLHCNLKGISLQIHEILCANTLYNTYINNQQHQHPSIRTPQHLSSGGIRFQQITDYSDFILAYNLMLFYLTHLHSSHFHIMHPASSIESKNKHARLPLKHIHITHLLRSVLNEHFQKLTSH